MKDITLQPINRHLSVATETSVLDVLLSQQCPVIMACGGNGVCATCHVFVKNGWESLTPVTERERMTLELITGARENSRLSCQCRVVGPVEIELPEGLYVESFKDLEALIGRRTQVPILHPRDGRVLIQRNKIISRTAIMQLQDVDFDVRSVPTSQK